MLAYLLAEIDKIPILDIRILSPWMEPVKVITIFVSFDTAAPEGTIPMVRISPATTSTVCAVSEPTVFVSLTAQVSAVLTPLTLNV